MKKIIFLCNILVVFIFAQNQTPIQESIQTPIQTPTHDQNKNKDKTYLIGFSQDTLKNDWRVAQIEEAKNEVKKYNNLKLELKIADSSVSQQLVDLEEFIDKKVDFILTSPINSKVTSPVLKKALDNGIGVILISRGVEGDGYTSFIAPNNYEIAKKGAHFLAQKLNGKGTILVLQGIDGTTVTKDRDRGFDEIMNSYPGIKLIRKRANSLRSDAIGVTEKLIQEGVDFDAVYSHSDSMLSGFRVAMKKANKSLNIPTVGIDYIKEAKEAILNGEQTASFTYPTSSKEGIWQIVKIINGEKIQKNISIESVLVTKDNAKSIEPIF